MQLLNIGKSFWGTYMITNRLLFSEYFKRKSLFIFIIIDY